MVEFADAVPFVVGQVELPRISLFETHKSVYLDKGRRTLNGWIREDSLYGSWYGFHAGVWSYSDLEGKTYRTDGGRRHGEPVEWDYYAGYDFKIGENLPLVNYFRFTVRYMYYE
ncbi:MAG: hypothetical protein IJJ26_10340 [Victivallales bacterium]|nr:hypothetical protein [Victivallales bacterium]